MSIPPPAATATTPPSATGHRPWFGSLMAAEWTKIRSVRSTFWTIVSFAIVTIGVTALVSWAVEGTWHDPRSASSHAAVIADPAGQLLAFAGLLGQLVIGVLGVLVISTEYSTGVIRSSLLAVPRRLQMLAAKAVVFTVLMLIVTEIVAFCSFFVSVVILHPVAHISLSSHDVTRSVIGVGLYLTVIGLLSLGIGGLIRHTAGAVATTLGILLLLPVIGGLLGGLLPGSWGTHINAYLPEQAGSNLASAIRPPSPMLGAWPGFGVLCAWAAIMLIGTAILLKKRDA